MSEKRKAFLYGRVSTATQAEGGYGLDRQLEAAKKFLEIHPEYEVDNSNIIQDSGVSAYSGGNIADSAGLGGFLGAVRSGAVPRGSLLVIEAPDRLTRLGIRRGQRLFDELADHGIDVGLVRFGVIIRHNDDNDFTSSLIVSVGLYLGHLESQQKSERISATMASRREQMRKGELKDTSHRPKWLDLNADGTNFKLGVAAKAIKEMFRLRLLGYGSDTITKHLNENAFHHYQPMRLWKKHNVTHHLRSRSVLGEYQPHSVESKKGKRVNVPSGAPIADYYPRIVSDEDFYAVQSMLDDASGGRTESFHNYLRGIAKCHVCGSKMMYVTTTARGRRFSYLRCTSFSSRYKEPKCGANSINIETINKKVTPALMSFNYVEAHDMSDHKRPDSHHHTEDTASLRESIEENKKALQYLSGAARDAVKSVIKETEKTLAKMVSRAASLNTALSIGEVEESQARLSDCDLSTPEGRALFNNALSKLVHTLHFYKDTWVIQFKDTDVSVRFEYAMEDPSKTLRAIFKHRRALSSDDISIEQVNALMPD